jgi:hypothetical protein
VPAGAGAGAHLDRLERTLGGRLPLSIRCFYEVVDRVSFAEAATHLYRAPCAYEMWGATKDPLIITPVTTAATALREALAGWRALPVPQRDPLELRLGPSRAVKYDIDDGPDDDPLRVVLEEPGADPAVRGGGFDVSFVAYLRQIVRGGGFADGDNAALQDGATTF